MGGSYKLGYYGAWGRGGRDGPREREGLLVFRVGRRVGKGSESVGVPPLRHPAPGTPLQEGVPSQTGVPAPIIIITLQGESGAVQPHRPNPANALRRDPLISPT